MFRRLAFILILLASTILISCSESDDEDESSNTSDSESSEIVSTYYYVGPTSNDRSTRVVAMTTGDVYVDDVYKATLNPGEPWTSATATNDLLPVLGKKITATAPIVVTTYYERNAEPDETGIAWVASYAAGKTFASNTGFLSDINLYFVALENADITITATGDYSRSFSLNSGAATSDHFNPSLGTGVGITIQSTGNVLVYSVKESNGTQQSVVMPAYTDIIGIPSNFAFMSAITEVNNVRTVNSIGETNSPQTWDQSGINPNVTDGDGHTAPATRFTAESPIGGKSSSNNGGDAASPFVPTNLLKTKFILPGTCRFVAFASISAGTITVKNAVTGAFIETIELTNSGTYDDEPFKAYEEGNGSEDHCENDLVTYESTVPMAVWFQYSNKEALDASGGAASRDETFLFGFD